MSFHGEDEFGGNLDLNQGKHSNFTDCYCLNETLIEYYSNFTSQLNNSWHNESDWSGSGFEENLNITCFNMSSYNTSNCNLNISNYFAYGYNETDNRLTS